MSRQYLQPAKGFFKAEVYITQKVQDGSEIICKDYSRFAGTWRAPLARRMVQHEYNMLSQLKKWPFAPDVYPSGSPLILCMEYLPGKPLADAPVNNPSAVYRTLFVALAQLHKMRIAHNDMRLTNVLLQNDRPVFIDFTASCSLPRLPGFMKILRWLQFADLRHLLKIKKHLQLSLTQREQTILYRSKREQWFHDLWREHLLPRLKRREQRKHSD